MYIPYNVRHRVSRDENLAVERSKRRKWVRHERDHSNSLWHTGWKILPDGRWFLVYEDDASRFVTGYGVFENPTAANTIKVLDEAVKNYGKPASIMTDHNPQFYASESEVKRRGVSEFEKKLVELGIRQILIGARRTQTNGKLARLHGEIERKLHEFEEIMMRKSEPIDLFMNWYNYKRPHQSLDRANRETPYKAFQRKMPPRGETVIDKQAGEYDVQ